MRKEMNIIIIIIIDYYYYTANVHTSRKVCCLFSFDKTFKSDSVQSSR